MTKIQRFIEHHLLKKQEIMEWVETEEDLYFIGYVVKRTPRTYRRLARLYATNKGVTTSAKPMKALLDLRLSIHRMKEITVASKYLEGWLREGWIVRKVELSPDGRTSKKQGYLMGPALFSFVNNEKNKKVQEEEERFKKYQSQLKKCTLSKDSSTLSTYIDHLLSLDYSLLADSTHFRNWPNSKRMRFISFLIAILTLREQKEVFDFKEIGATYFKGIGGSKVFDRYQADFINLLEEWSGNPIHEIGLVSHGHITPVYFTGHVEGKLSSYDYGSLHAVTDVALLKDQYTTTARVIWLVENRAILTRMVESSSFLKETKSLVISVDGHIRSAHHQFVKQLRTSMTVEQVLIWTDYDEAGMTIARESSEIVNDKKIKFVASNGSVFDNYSAYKEWLRPQLQVTKREQEEVLGDECIWRKWINH